MRARALTVAALTALLLLTGVSPALGAPGDSTGLTDTSGAQVMGVEVDENGDGKTDGYDLDLDGSIDVYDDDGDGTVDRRREGAAPPPDGGSGCFALNFVCKAGEAVDDAFTDLANYTIEAVGDAAASTATFWLGAPSPDLGARRLDSNNVSYFAPAPAVAFIQERLTWLVGALAVVSVLIGAGKMGWERRAQPGRDLVRSLVTLVLIAGSGLAVVSALLAFGDAFSVWMVEQATDDFGASLVSLLSLDSADVGVLAVLLIIVLGLISLLSLVVQIALLVVRHGYVVVLAGTWSLSAAATNTEQGRAAFQRQTSWLLAFVLYKPVASIVYATAFQMVGTAGAGTDPVGQSIAGFALVVTALVALPALMRLIAPAVGAAVSGGGSGGAGALAAGVAAAPAGAAIMRSSGGSGGFSGGGGGAGRRPGGPAGAGPTGGRPPGPAGAGAAGAGDGAAGAAAGAATAVVSRGVTAAQALGGKAAGSPPPPSDPGGPRGK